MADYEFLVNLAWLRNSINTRQAIIAKLNSAIDNLQNENRQLKAEWEGNAETAYTGNLDADIQAITSIRDGLNGVVAHENLAVSEYSKAEDHALAVIGGLKS